MIRAKKSIANCTVAWGCPWVKVVGLSSRSREPAEVSVTRVRPHVDRRQALHGQGFKAFGLSLNVRYAVQVDPNFWERPSPAQQRMGARFKRPWRDVHIILRASQGHMIHRSGSKDRMGIV